MAAPVEVEVIFTNENQSSRLQEEAREEERPVATEPFEANEENSQSGKKGRGCFGARQWKGPKTRKPPSKWGLPRAVG